MILIFITINHVNYIVTLTKWKFIRNYVIYLRSGQRKEENSPLLAAMGIGVTGALIFLVALCLCLRKARTSRKSEDSKLKQNGKNRGMNSNGELSDENNEIRLISAQGFPTSLNFGEEGSNFDYKGNGLGNGNSETFRPFEDSNYQKRFPVTKSNSSKENSITFDTSVQIHEIEEEQHGILKNGKPIELNFHNSKSRENNFHNSIFTENHFHNSIFTENNFRNSTITENNAQKEFTRNTVPKRILNHVPLSNPLEMREVPFSGYNSLKRPAAPSVSHSAENQQLLVREKIQKISIV